MVAQDPEILIEPVRGQVFDAWTNELIVRWTLLRSTSGQMTPEEAATAATRIISRLLPDGNGPPQQHLRSVRRHGQELGTFWLEVREENAFLFDFVEVASDSSQELLDVVEEYARSLGARILRVNVYRNDAPAKRAVEGRGFAVSNSQMLLDLAAQLEVRDPQSETGVELRPMTQNELNGYLTHQEASYAADLVHARSASPSDAMEQAQRETKTLLPNGLASPGQLLFTAFQNSRPVGTFWMELSGPEDQSRAFILDIEVVGPLRGQGLGRAIMDAALLECRKRNVKSVRLSVFGFSSVARNLYLSLNFQVLEEILWKEL